MKEWDNVKQESWLQNWGSYKLSPGFAEHKTLEINMLNSQYMYRAPAWFSWDHIVLPYSAKVLSFLWNLNTKWKASVHIQHYLALRMGVSTAAIPCDRGYQLASPTT